MAEETIPTETTESNGIIDPVYVEKAVDWLIANGTNLLAAILIFFIGKWVAKVIRNKVKSLMEKKEVDAALVSFATNMLYYMLIIAVTLAAVQKIGFQTTSLVAILGAAGLAVGLALQGSLSNFASGVLIILFRPFGIGDVITAGGVTACVKEIGVLVTIMATPDNKKIIMPNSSIMGGAITNITAYDTRRVDMTVGVSYSDDLDKVANIIEEVIAADDRILKDPAVTIAVSELADSSVNFVVRPWVNKADYWGVFFDFQKTIKQRLDKEGVSIPFPQQDVHMHQVSN
ncbi:mechanosensitive ion channel [Puniceicoccaceae bacterium K14]|nr:mechanosensitive ion channel [Puniceicoccaceae bacterium K14]